MLHRTMKSRNKLEEWSGKKEKKASISDQLWRFFPSEQVTREHCKRSGGVSGFAASDFVVEAKAEKRVGPKALICV